MSKDVIIDLAKLRNYEINGEAYFALDDVVKFLNIPEADLTIYKNYFPECFTKTAEGIEVVNEFGLEELMLKSATSNPEAKCIADKVLNWEELHQVTMYILDDKELLYNLDDVLKTFSLTEDDIAVLRDALPECFINLEDYAIKTIKPSGFKFLLEFAWTDRKPEEFKEWFETENPKYRDTIAQMAESFKQIQKLNPELTTHMLKEFSAEE